MQWIIDSSPQNDAWTSERVIQETLALWFGSVHQLAMVCRSLSFRQYSVIALITKSQSFTYALYDLCEHPEYITPLREELEKATLADYSLWHTEHMPRLDSFLKESARLNPSDASKSTSARVQPFFTPNTLT